MSVFALGGGIYLPAEGVGECLHSVADAQNRQTCFEDEILNIRRTLFIDRPGSAGKDESLRLDRKNLLDGRIPCEKLTVDLRFTHSPRNDLRILRTKVKDGDG